MTETAHEWANWKLRQGRDLEVYRLPRIAQAYAHTLVCLEPDWVLEQTRERLRRELERVDVDYAEKLAAARKREAQLRKLSRGHVRKRQVVIYLHG